MSFSLKYETVAYTRGTVLEIAGKSFPHFLCVDTPRDGVRPDIRVEHPEDLSLVVEDKSADAVYCDQYEKALDGLKDWWRCIKVGGYLIVNFLGEAVRVIDVMRGTAEGWNLVERSENENGTLFVFEKRNDAVQKQTWMVEKKPKKTACVVRYGGFGDMIQAANLFPELKRQGYHVTVMTTPKGKEIIQHDPHVDAWYLQDSDQVPNTELAEFWKVISKRYDKFVNLCESVEGTLLAMPGRANHGWPHSVRNRWLNENYLEFTSELAGVPYSSDSHFYPSDEEKDVAKSRLLPGGFNVVWALSGSSCHKFYPWQDSVIARILIEKPDCRIFLVGDGVCKLLEVGWEKESRVVPLAGEIGIRDTLALAKFADAVIGCETGVLNAVAFEYNRKVVLLSHSSHENLTKHWNNTAALAPESTPCYPCHRLHYSREFCPEEPTTGAAMCQFNIHPDRVYAALIGEQK